MARRRRNGTDLLGLVGWVFADMLLVLALVFLATQPGNPNGSDRLAPRSTTTSTPTSSTTTTIPPTTTTTIPPGVDSEFVCFLVNTNPSVLEGPDGPEKDAHLADLQAQTEARLAENGLLDRKAGIVLTFGVAPTAGPGKTTADAYNKAVLPRIPAVFTAPDGGPTANRAFWDGAGGPGKQTGTVAVNVYPITDTDHPPLPRGSGQPC